MAEEHLTERQQKWFASIREGLVRDTGKTLEEWAAIARTCPETKPRARMLWLKEHHGLGQNRAATVLEAAFPSSMGWEEPDQLRAALWKDAGSLSILEALEKAVSPLPGLTKGQRKGFTAWSRKVQFAAARPLKGGCAALGLAISPNTAPRLEPAANDGWSERLKSRTVLTSPADVDDGLAALLKAAWETS